MENLDVHDCMDIFDWFDDSTFDYVSHILLCKIDGEKRVRRAAGDAQARTLPA